MTSEHKKDTRFTVDEASGKLKIDTKDPEEKANTLSEVYVLQALQRRSWALDQANGLSEVLIRARLTDPPPGFQKPCWDQLVAADKKFFSELRDATRARVHSNAAGTMP